MNDKAPKDVKELIDAARVAYADPVSDAFWAEFAKYQEERDRNAEESVKKRDLTES